MHWRVAVGHRFAGPRGHGVGGRRPPADQPRRAAYGGGYEARRGLLQPLPRSGAGRGAGSLPSRHPASPGRSSVAVIPALRRGLPIIAQAIMDQVTQPHVSWALMATPLRM